MAMRRLSSGSNYLGAFVDEEEQELDAMSELASVCSSRRNSRNDRRRSSMHGSKRDSSRSPQKSAAEQQRVAEMYKVVIKMSAENKINMKNSWSFDLIDQMGKIIREEGRGGVNFQKASCTLDASIKIYSHRVDDTHASSHRILESLSRNDDKNDNDDNNNEDDGTEDGTTSNATSPRANMKAKVGSKAMSHRLNIESSIEKNIDNINQAVIEKGQSVDPTFHKMSKAFDEGGAKGMLMNNMRVSSSSSSLNFSSECLIGNTDIATTAVADNNHEPIVSDANRSTHAAAPTEISATPAVLPLFDLSSVLNKFGMNSAELVKYQICPALDDYRVTLMMGGKDGIHCKNNDDDDDEELMKLLRIDLNSSSSFSSLSQSCTFNNRSNTSFLNSHSSFEPIRHHDNGDDEHDDDGYDGGGGCGGDYDDDNDDGGTIDHTDDTHNNNQHQPSSFTTSNDDDDDDWNKVVQGDTKTENEMSGSHSQLLSTSATGMSMSGDSHNNNSDAMMMVEVEMTEFSTQTQTQWVNMFNNNNKDSSKLLNTQNENENDHIAIDKKEEQVVNDDDNDDDEIRSNTVVERHINQHIDIVPFINNNNNNNTTGSGSNDYSYFDMKDVTNNSKHNNAWAGAKHWKFGCRVLRSVAIHNQNHAENDGNDNNDNNDDVSTLTGKGKRSKKQASAASTSNKSTNSNSTTTTDAFIDFSSPWPTRDAFMTVSKTKRRTKHDVTIMTSSALEKQASNATNGVYDLPPDAKLQVKDMCRLFLCPTLIVPPTRAGYGQLLTSQLHLHSQSQSASATAAGTTAAMSGWSKQTHERVWGVPIDTITRTTATTRTTHVTAMSGTSGSSSTSYPFSHNNNAAIIGGTNNNATGYDDDDDNDYDGGGGGGNDYGDDDDDYRTDYNYTVNDNDPSSSSSAASVMKGLEINTDNLLKAARTVDKVDIGYATVSTKVNVRKLKSDIWEHISTNITSSLSSRRNSLYSTTTTGGGSGGSNNNSTTRASSSLLSSHIAMLDTENVNPLDVSSSGNNNNNNSNPKLSLNKQNNMSSFLDTTTNTMNMSTTQNHNNGNNDDDDVLNGESLSFRHLISTVSQKQETQSSVSLPFYFICLLHLANEKSLEIHSSENMDDLKINF